MKHLSHTLREISLLVVPGSTIQEVAKEVIEYRDYTNCISISFLFNRRYIYVDKSSTVDSIISDYYNKKRHTFEYIEVTNDITGIMRSFQEQCGASYDFRTIIDNLPDEDICDCFLTWMKENGYKKQ